MPTLPWWRKGIDEAHEHGLPVTAHPGTAQDLAEVLAAGVEGLEHVDRLPDGWPDGRNVLLVLRDGRPVVDNR